VILDGFPRNLKQAEALDKVLSREAKAIDKVVYIKVSEEGLIKRLSDVGFAVIARRRIISQVRLPGFGVSAIGVAVSYINALMILWELSKSDWRFTLPRQPPLLIIIPGLVNYWR